MTLIDEAELAEHISEIFGRYRAPNPNYIQTINATIAGLARLAWTLREISTLLDDVEHGENLYLIEGDLKFVHGKVSGTLQDVWDIIGTIGSLSDGFPTQDDFRRNWKRIVRYCYDTGRQDLSIRFEIYTNFLSALCTVLKSQSQNREQFGAMRQDVREIGMPPRTGLLEIPDEAQPIFVENTLVTQPKSPTKRPSYERHRVSGPISPSYSDASSSPFGDTFGAVPSPPMSPADTSSISQMSSIDQELEQTEHWARQIFRDIPSWTPFPDSGEKSKYHSSYQHPNQGHPGPNYEDAVVLSFPPDPPGYQVALMYRRKDLRAKVSIKWRDRQGRLCIACLPMDTLEIIRMGTVLYLCRRVSHRQTLKWMSLAFLSIEKLVLFQETFLSMRAYDGKKPVNPSQQWQSDDEEREFHGEILDEHHTSYLLQIYRDKLSGALRLQASVLHGPMKRTPVWTAFVTHPITSRSWCERFEKTKVCLRELQPRIYSHEFEFSRLQTGAFVLEFETREDTKNFMERVEDLRREYRKKQ